MLNSLGVVYLLSNLFGLYVIFCYMKIFFYREHVNQKREFLSYLLYYVISAVLYFYFRVPMINLIFNVLAFLLISYHYPANFKYRVLSITYIYSILMIVDLSCSGLIERQFFPVYIRNHYTSYGHYIIPQIVLYVLSRYLQHYQNINKQVQLPVKCYFLLLLIPMGTFYMICVLVSVKELPILYIGVGLLVSFIINLAAFTLYDYLVGGLIAEQEKNLLQRQNHYCDLQLSMMQTANQKSSQLRHDWHNHLSTLMTLHYSKEYQTAEQYIKDLLHANDTIDVVCQTGNHTIDGLLNFKYMEMQQNQINAIYKINIPAMLQITSFDIVTILSNLLDNAIQAILKLDNGKDKSEALTTKKEANDAEDSKRTIRLVMKYNRGCLVIRVINSFDGNLSIDSNGALRTTKKDAPKHSIGLENVQSTVAKYHGEMQYRATGQLFTMNVILYV